MGTRLIRSAAIAVLVVATDAAAQTDVGLNAVGLVSIQPVDESWVGMPYLNEGLGGIGPGLGTGIHAVKANGFTFGAEVSIAFFSAEQEGRLISGSTTGITEVNTLHDALLTGLAGYSQRHGNTEVRYLAGAGTLLSDQSKADFPFVPTAGIDVVQSVSGPIAVLITGRYAYVTRTSNGTALAAGPHLIRAGAGIRIKLN